MLANPVMKRANPIVHPKRSNPGGWHKPWGMTPLNAARGEITGQIGLRFIDFIDFTDFTVSSVCEMQ